MSTLLENGGRVTIDELVEINSQIKYDLKLTFLRTQLTQEDKKSLKGILWNISTILLRAIKKCQVWIRGLLYKSSP